MDQINRHRQTITGPVLKSREELTQRVLDGERFQKFMQSHADTQQMPLSAVRAAAEKCLEEISADLRPNWIRFYSAIMGWILRTLFDGVTMNRAGLAAVKRMALRGAVIYVPSHKSHVDYLILSYMLYHQDLPCPLVAAGKNLSFWPMGPLFRRGGAFFIRRSFRGAVLYSRVFAEYIHTLLEEGYSIEQFIEGGRSRTGKLLMPKLGLLSILLKAQKNGACNDLIFVPVSIGYDRVPEETSYLQEIEGGQKQPETIWQVLKARKFLKRRYGKVYLQFNAPLSTNDLAGSLGASLKAMPPKEFNAFCRGLGHRIAHAINQVSVVTPQALVAAAILNGGRDRFEIEDAIAVLEVYLIHLETVGAKLADTLILDHRRAAAHALQSYVQRKILEAIEHPAAGADGAAGFILKEAKRPVLDYYKNTCVVFFIPAAFTALAILQKDAFQFSASDLHADVEFLKQLFQYEFVLDPDATSEQMLRESLHRFYQDAVLVPHPELPDTFNVTSAGFRKLRLFAMFLKTFLESYGVVLAYFRHAPQDPGDAKERIKKITSLGSRMLKNKEIESREALSKVTYENAVEFFTSQGIKGAENREPINDVAAAIGRALRCLTRDDGAAMKALILAAGLGTRLLPYTRRTPKSLFPLAGRPLLEHHILRLQAAGCEAVIVNTHHLHVQVEAFIAARRWEIPVRTRHEPEILGTGGAIRNVRDFWDERPFFVVNSDITSGIDLRQVYEFHLRQGPLATLVLVDDPEFNSVTVEPDGRIRAFAASAAAAPPGALTFTGVQVLDPAVLDYIPAEGFSHSIDAFRAMIAGGRVVRAFIAPHAGWVDLGTPERYRWAAPRRIRR